MTRAGNTGRRDAATTGSTARRRGSTPPRRPAATRASPSWSFSATGAASLQCRLERGTELVEDWATCTSPKVWDLAGKPEGTYTFSVRALDADGDASAGVPALPLDTTAPATPGLRRARPPASAPAASPRWTWTGDAGATFECRTDRDGHARWSLGRLRQPAHRSTSPPADGRYTLAVRARRRRRQPQRRGAGRLHPRPRRAGRAELRHRAGRVGHDAERRRGASPARPAPRTSASSSATARSSRRSSPARPRAGTTSPRCRTAPTS